MKVDILYIYIYKINRELPAVLLVYFFKLMLTKINKQKTKTKTISVKSKKLLNALNMQVTPSKFQEHQLNSTKHIYEVENKPSAWQNSSLQ